MGQVAPRASPSSVALNPALPHLSWPHVGPALVPEPPRFLESLAERGATLWLAVFGFGVFFWTVSVFLFCFLSLALSAEL